MTGNGIFFPSRPGLMNGAVFTKIKIPLMPAAFYSLKHRLKRKAQKLTGINFELISANFSTLSYAGLLIFQNNESPNIELDTFQRSFLVDKI